MGRVDYDVYKAFRTAPSLMGLDLRMRNGQWQGPYYMNGDLHPYRKDKLKVFTGKDGVWVSEEGGDAVSIIDWLIAYRGADGYKGALRMLREADGTLRWTEESKVRRKDEGETLYVPKGAVEGARAYGLGRCPLFGWMCGLWPEGRVTEAWDRYGVTSDSHGNCVYWYIDSKGDVCFDKRMAYGSDGHRDKTFFPGRQYRKADGYSGRCLFGDNWVDYGKPVYVVESEKTALMVWLMYGRQCVACGGKGGLRAEDVRDGMVLLPDYDARGEWSKLGKVWPWWEKWGVPEVPPTADIGDMIEYKIKRSRT